MTKNENTTLEDVKIFHKTYGAMIKDQPDISNKAINDFRITLLQEELDELKEALENNDIVEVLDALTDIQYVLDGAYLSFGLHPLKQRAFNEVQSSNMSKLGADGKPILRESDGKILKGPNYFKPNLKALLEEEAISIGDAA